MASEAYLRRKRQEEMGIIQPATSKRCRHCGQTKDRDEFPPSKMVSDGLSFLVSRLSPGGNPGMAGTRACVRAAHEERPGHNPPGGRGAVDYGFLAWSRTGTPSHGARLGEIFPGFRLARHVLAGQERIRPTRGLRFLARTCTVSGMAKFEQVPGARYTRRVVFWEEPRIIELIEQWADEGATSQASILRLALRQFFKDHLAADEPEVV
jgi:hypothetical protein